MWEICIECLASSPTPEHFQDGRISQQMGTLSLSHSQPLRINCLLIGQKYISNGKHDGSNTRIYKKLMEVCSMKIYTCISKMFCTKRTHSNLLHFEVLRRIRHQFEENLKWAFSLKLACLPPKSAWMLLRDSQSVSLSPKLFQERKRREREMKGKGREREWLGQSRERKDGKREER